MTNEVSIPNTITLEICGEIFVLDPQAEDFDRQLKKAMRRLHAWGVLCRAFAEPGATAAGLRNS